MPLPTPHPSPLSQGERGSNRLVGETPSRAAPSCPARRSRAIEAWGGIRQAMTLPTPRPSPLPQGERGSNRSRRGWRAKPHRGRSPRVLHGEAMPWRRGTTLHPAMPLPTPHPSPLPQGERGSNRSLRGSRAKPHRGRSPRVLNGEAVPLRRGAAFARQCCYRPLTLSRKGRGDQTEVSEVGGRNPIEDGVLVSCAAKPCY